MRGGALITPVLWGAAAIWLGLVPLVAFAREGFCEIDPGEPLPATREATELKEHEMAGQTEACEGFAVFLAYRGALVNALGRHGEAATLLERALMLAPEMASARIDYANALASLGERDAAESVLRDLRARPDLPGGLGGELDERIGQLSPSHWRTRLGVELRGGHETNLNSAPANRDYELTLPEGSEVFQLAEGQSARPGPAIQWLIEAEAVDDAFMGGQLALRGSFNQRESFNVADYRQMDLSGRFNHPVASGSWNTGMGLAHFEYAGRSVLNEMRMQTGFIRDGEGMSWGGGVEWVGRYSPANPSYDGQYQGLSFETVWQGQASSWLNVKSGFDRPVRQRAGGKQERREVKWGHRRGFYDGLLSANIDWSEERDREGYSPLLESGAPRVVRKQQFGLRLQWPVDPQCLLVAEVQNIWQRANLPLFEFQNTMVYLGVQRKWGGK